MELTKNITDMKRKTLQPMRRLMILASTAFLWALPSTFLRAQFVDFDFQYSFDDNFAAGILVCDYDEDGLEDILILNGRTETYLSNSLYRNTGAGFEDVSADILPTHYGRYNAGAMADFNGDGHRDLYLAAWNFSSTNYLENILLAGDGNGGYNEASAGPPTTDESSTAGCSWADVNGDGWVDLFLANLSTSFSAAPNALYTNEGNGTFSSNPDNLLVNGASRFSFSGNWADVDGDKDLDVYVANAHASDQLYYNDGAGNFTINTDDVEFNQINTISYRAAWGDFDNDGDLDFFVPTEVEFNYLYENDGAGHFTRTAGPWEDDDDDTACAAWADFDNDGDLDLFLTSFYGNNNYLFRNDGGVFIREESHSIPVLDGFSGIADLDNDGFLDIVMANGGFPDTYRHVAVYFNQGNDNHWLEFNLRGNAPNTMAIGAVVRVKATINGQEVWQMRQVASSSHESNSPRLHFGLGDALFADEVVIEWPDGAVESYEGFVADGICTIVQGELPACPMVGIDEKGRLPATLTLAPNPARETTLLNLETEAPIGRCAIRLLNLTGQEAWAEQQAVNGKYLKREINLKGLPPGLYAVQVQAEGQQIVKTLVITP